jgi:hypothetical protein
MGIFRRRGPSIPELKQQASGTMDAALDMFEVLVDEIRDGVSFVFIKQSGGPLWKSLLTFLTSDEEASFPIGVRLKFDEEQDEDER